MDIILDGREFRDRKTGHEYIKEKFSLADYYGMNLDALWDSLSQTAEEFRIVIVNQDELIKSLGDYGLEIIKIFEELDEEADNIVYYKL